MTGLDCTELIISNRPQYSSDNDLIEEIQNVTRTVPTLRQLSPHADSGTVYTRSIPHRRLRFVMKNAELYSFAVERSDDR